MNGLSVSLLPGYNSDIMFTVPSSANPVVKINGDTVNTSLNEGRFAFVIKGINALNPVKKYTVSIDDSVFTFSLLSYWSLSEGNERSANTADAFKALYELYHAALDCQQ
ncbi:MAG: hypothetical protein KBT31_03770, partial [Firmicutes bacterium]|nr:hypothetical protein [Candidatus Colimorpha enterica]